ncbi:MAG: GNAT family N-acetyltransferase [Actinobacteria bacterium]|nr:GNAT family N-acetyltransferase [Actinomycetota bacterium]
MHSDGLRLERLRLEHAPMLFAALDDPRVGHFIGGPDVTTLEALRARIDRVTDGPPPESGQTWLNFAVLLGPTVIGRVEATVHEGIAEIAYLIGPRWWGCGYGAAATSLLLDNLAVTGVTDYWATTMPDNLASVGVLVHLGFSEVETRDAPLLHSYDDGDRVFHRRDARP